MKDRSGDTDTGTDIHDIHDTLGHGHPHGHDHGAHHRPHNLSHTHDHGHVHLTMEHWDPDARRDDEEEEEVTGVEMTAEVKIGHRRQVVGILVSYSILP